jgi:hypothetical protein
MNKLALHAQIDEEYEHELAALEQEFSQRRAVLAEGRDREHAALDRRWTKATGDSGASTEGTPPLALDEEDGWPAFMANDVIQALVETCEGNERINVNWVFRRAIQQDPQLKARRPQIIRAQISRTLLKLTNNGVLEMVRKGKGGQPHLYQRVPPATNGGGSAG